MKLKTLDSNLTSREEERVLARIILALHNDPQLVWILIEWSVVIQGLQCTCVDDRHGLGCVDFQQ